MSEWLLHQLLIMRQGEGNERWLALLRLTSLTAVGMDSDPVVKKRLLLENTSYVVYYIFLSFRIGFSGLFDQLNHHVFGHTLISVGNIHRLFMMLCGTVILQLAMYRLANLWSIRSGDYGLLQILGKGSNEQMETGSGNKLQNHKKQRMSRLVYNICVTLSLAYIPLACFFVTVLFYFNVHQSSDTNEIMWWTFWWTQDVMGVCLVTASLITFPGTWLLIVLDYCFNVSDVRKMVHQLRHDDDSSTEEAVQIIMKKLGSLEKQADQVNQSSAPIMFIVNLCTTSTSCTCLFSCIFADMMLAKVVIAIAGFVVTLLPISLQWIAGHVTAESEQLIQTVTAYAVNHAALSPDMRSKLLQDMEDLGSERHPLAIYTMTGEKCTSLAFFGYLMETAVQFFLIYSFSSYFLTSVS